MSHLLEVLYLMFTISILPFACINTIWQWQQPMHHSNIVQPENASPVVFYRRGGPGRYKKHNKERILYINNEQM
jgi:hypothetical protein